MSSILQTPSGSGKVFPTSQVANQRYQNSAIKDGYTTNIPDQGISINASGQPYDHQPDHSERRSPPPHQGGGATEGGHGPPQGPPGILQEAYWEDQIAMETSDAPPIVMW
jgi:hypothetical protein